MAIFLFALLSLIWGTTWLGIKISLQGFPPFTGAAVRFIVALILLAAYAISQKISFKIPHKDFGKIFLTSFFMYTFDYGLVYWGEQYLNAGVTAIFFATFPIFIAIFSNFIFHQEPFHLLTFSGLLTGFTGTVVLFLDQLIKTDFNLWIGLAALAVVLGAAGGALSTVLVKKYFQSYHPVSLTFHQMIWGMLFLGLIGWGRGEWQHVAIGWPVLAAILYLGAIGSAFAFVCYYWLLKNISAITLSLIIYITPIVALFLDWLLYGYRVNLRMVGGIILVFLGVFLTQYRDYRQYLWQRRFAQSMAQDSHIEESES